MVEGTNGHAIAIISAMVAVIVLGSVAIFTGFASNLAQPTDMQGCIETDGGNDPIAVGFTQAKTESGTDYCINQNVVHEHFCTFFGEMDDRDVPCDRGYTCKTVTENGLTGGACKPISSQLSANRAVL